MNGSVSRKLRKESYPKDYSKRDTSYAKNSIAKFFQFFNSKGEETVKRKIRFGQAVCTGMRNIYKQKKKAYMACRKEGIRYLFVEVV